MPVRRQEHLAKRHFLSPDAESRAADGTPLAVRRGEPRRKDSAAAELQTYQSRRTIAMSERFAGRDSTTIPSRPSGRNYDNLPENSDPLQGQSRLLEPTPIDLSLPITTYLLLLPITYYCYYLLPRDAMRKRGV